MIEQGNANPRLGAAARRARWGWIVSAIGLFVTLAGVLYMTSSTIGGPIHEFRERRTYSEVKTEAHRAWPVTMVLGLAGLGLMMLGTRMRASARKPDASG